MGELSLVTTVLTLLFPTWSAALVESTSGPGGLLAVASLVAAAGVVVVLVVCHAHAGRLDVASSPIRTRAQALRERSRRAAFLRLRDPDAAGRSRPRAPGQRHPSVG
ncbi:DUF6412 domain-containing protein [Goodfellowiella coeruleoviolacea]|uniref:Uncharacterized protein n=1 Tax=Goodfellowiella coeruleoviolacea TaxID=334858 RepID=A0AAE3KFJ0_9PSEU|nr:DUF6412 domain-containing protein [Goodfellowiella coeruleoviolacea]MCP2165005.1 hypothetical protein [Goodfellowiella coeruleoviolacea]